MAVVLEKCSRELLPPPGNTGCKDTVFIVCPLCTGNRRAKTIFYIHMLGSVTRLIFFWRSFKLNQYCLYMRRYCIVLIFSGYLVKEKNNYKVSACFVWKQLLILRIVPKEASKFLSLLSCAVIGQFSSVYTVYMSLPAFGTTFRVTRINKWFREASRKFCDDF